MFEIWIGSSAFNQPVAAWDVGQVTKMSVRRRPRVGSRRGWGGCGAGGPLHATVSPTRHARAVAQQMFKGASAFNQPVEAWDVDQVTRMDVRRRLRQEPGEVRGGVGLGRGPLPLQHPLGVHMHMMP